MLRVTDDTKLDFDDVFLDYDQIFLVPDKTVVASRQECDTSVTFGKIKFDLPVIPANMKSVVDQNTCKYLHDKNLFYIMHRFNMSIYDFVMSCNDNGMYSSVSIGVNDFSYQELKKINQIDYITLDVANAWALNAKDMISYIADNFPDSTFIVGNVATPEACEEIIDWGQGYISAIKCGIAGGKVCITKNKTGFHIPMVNTVAHCSKVCKKHGIFCIADGGIVEHGDVAKAIALGADMVMAGSLFAGYEESAGDIVEIQDKLFKEYYGSASAENKGKHKNVEGKKILIDYKGKMSRLIDELKEDLQSAISYSGGKNIQDLKNTPYIVKK